MRVGEGPLWSFSRQQTHLLRTLYLGDEEPGTQPLIPGRWIPLRMNPIHCHSKSSPQVRISRVDSRQPT